MASNAKSGGRMSQATTDLILLAAITIFFAVILIQSLALSKTASLVPKLISSVALILCAIQIVTDMKKLKQEKEAGGAEKIKPVQFRWYYLLLILIAYSLGLYLIGFVPTAFLFLLITPYIMKQKNIKLNLLLAIVATAILYYAFVEIFYVRLPMGLLFDYFF